MPDETPKVWASLGCTINTGNYENQRIDIGVAGIPINATDEYLVQILEQASATLHKIVDGLAVEMGRRLQEDYGR